jgi:hypothetical protein
MKRLKRPAFPDSPWIREAAIYLAAFFIFTLILLNRSPNVLRPLSMNMRFGFTWIIPLLVVVLYISFHISGLPGRLIRLTATLSMFAMALAGVWASGQTQSTYISGLIPLYDAQIYYVDALRLLAGRSMSEFSAARPLFAGWLATILALTDRDLTVALMVLTAVNGMASYFAAETVRRTHGTVPAIFLLIFLFLYYRYRTVGAAMSENAGLAFGVIGVTLIWQGITNKSSWLALFGIFVHTLALNARPGPFIILPALLLWGSWYFRTPNERFAWRFFLLGILLIVAGFATSLLLKQFLGVSSGVPFSQFSYAFYGLASGGNSWAYIFEAHPELREMAHPEVTWTAYRLTFDLIRDQPALLLQGALRNWSTLFSDSWYGLFSYVGGENRYLNLVTRGFIFVLCLLGLVKWLQKTSDPYTSFVVASTAGILFSVPFVPPTDAYGMRLYAASIILFGLLAAMGLSFALEKLRIPAQTVAHVENSQGFIEFSVLLTSMMLIGPFLVRGTSPMPASAASCQPEMSSVVAHLDSGTSIRLIRERDPGLDWLPVFHFGFFRRNVHSVPDSRLANRLESIEPRSTLFYTLDYRSNNAALVIIPTAALPEPGSPIELCGEWESDPALEVFSIFVARSATVMLGGK